LYANIDGFKSDEKNIVPVAEREELDRWIISKLHSLIKDVCASYDDYEPTKAARFIEEFIDQHLSNWYVRLSRRRFWRSEMSADKKAAYETLYECLMVVSQLMSPVAPFFSDWLYRNLSDCIRDDASKNNSPLKYSSVHLSLTTKAEENVIDKSLEERMELAQKISSMTLSLRKKVNIRVRQPLNKILIPMSDDFMQNKIEAVKHLILSEVNVKSIEFLKDSMGFASNKKIKANFKTLGKKLGGLMKETAGAIAILPQNDINSFEENGKFALQLNGQIVDLSLEDVEITTEDIPGWTVNSEGKLTVALDTTITENLRHEGIARELVNRIQNLRKDKGFDVTDRISVKLKKHEGISPSVELNKDYICAEILAGSFTMVDKLETPAAIEIEVDDNIKTLIEIERM
jgi:isoleucyl-tRNA synthetase